MDTLKCLHYLNQFFGGVGGEEKAFYALQLVNGPVGPGRLLQNYLRDSAAISWSVVCGDGYFHEQKEDASRRFREILQQLRPDLVIAGPAFGSGRYGLACGEICLLAQKEGVETVTGMHRENPATEIYRQDVLIVATSDRALNMAQDLTALARVATKLLRKEVLATPDEEGYLPRGFRQNLIVQDPAAIRAVDLLVARLRGLRVQSEIPVQLPRAPKPPPPVKDMTQTILVLVTESGVVPKGNPDRIPFVRADRLGRYSVRGLDKLNGDSFETIHGGYDTRWISEDPNRVVPLDALRQMEHRGVFKRLWDTLYVTCGNGGSQQVMGRIGKEIAEELRKSGEDVSVILTAT